MTDKAALQYIQIILENIISENTPQSTNYTATCLPSRNIEQLCEDMGCSPEDLPEAMNDREKWRERVRDIRASGTT